MYDLGIYTSHVSGTIQNSTVFIHILGNFFFHFHFDINQLVTAGLDDCNCILSSI